MGSFLSFSSNPDDLELEPLSKSRTDQTPTWYSGRRHPLSPNGHSTSNLMSPSFRRRYGTNTEMQAQVIDATTPTDSDSDNGVGIALAN